MKARLRKKWGAWPGRGDSKRLDLLRQLSRLLPWCTAGKHSAAEPSAMCKAEGTAGEFPSAVVALGVSRSFLHRGYGHPFATQPSTAFKTML